MHVTMVLIITLCQVRKSKSIGIVFLIACLIAGLNKFCLLIVLSCYKHWVIMKSDMGLDTVV